MIEKILQQIKRKEDDWLSQKEIYALPDWFTLISQPQIVYLLPIHGTQGIQIIKQKVDFEVNFNNQESILKYANFLELQMNKKLPILSFVLFYKTISIGIKDNQYKAELTIAQKIELEQFNLQQNHSQISVVYLDKNYNVVETL